MKSSAAQGFERINQLTNFVVGSSKVLEFRDWNPRGSTGGEMGKKEKSEATAFFLLHCVTNLKHEVTGEASRI